MQNRVGPGVRFIVRGRSPAGSACARRLRGALEYTSRRFGAFVLERGPFARDLRQHELQPR
jgi:hypothetical protein